MGTMVQNLGLKDAAFGGPEFKMLTDLLVFSRPDDLEGIHLGYLQAGANLIETDTFGASPLRLKDVRAPHCSTIIQLYHPIL
jgi:5-methyltetrahydrofolate--homocysteine methyltransferase